MKKPKVLLLHTAESKEASEEIATQLERKGFSVNSQGRIPLGDSTIRKLDAWIELRHPIVFLGTRTALGDTEVNKQLAAARAKDVIVLPMQMEGRAALDRLFPDQDHAQYHTDPEGAIAKVVAALNAHFQASSSFLNRDAVPDDLTIHQDRVARVLLTDPLIGQEASLSEFRKALESTPILILHGPPGQGKTTIARALAEAYMDEMQGRVCEVDLRNETRVEALPELIGRALGLAADQSAYRAIRVQPCFLVLDGFDLLREASKSEQLEIVLGQLVTALGPYSKAVITCQSQIKRNGLKNRAVPKLHRTACLELLRNAAGSEIYSNGDSEELGDFLEDDLSGHPLSIIILGVYGGRLGLKFDQLRDLWQEEWDEIASEPTAIDQRALKASLELVYRRFDVHERRAFAVLSALPDGLHVDLVGEIWKEDKGKWLHALASLNDRRWQDVDLRYKGRHRLLGPIASFGRARLAEKSGFGTEAELVTDIDKVFDYYINSVGALQNRTEDIRFVRENFHNIHAALRSRLMAVESPKSLRAAEAVLDLYWAYKNNLRGVQRPVGAVEDAIDFLRRAEKVFVANEQPMKATECVQRVGNIYWLRGKTNEALRFLNDAARSEAGTLEDKLERERAFAHIEYKQGSILQSVDLYKNVIAGALKIGFSDCATRCQVGLIDSYRKLEKYEELAELFDEIAPKLSKLPNSIVANVYRGYAYAQACQGNGGEARALYEKAVKYFGENNPFGLAHCRRGVGDICIAEGDWDGAEAAFEDALELYREANKVPSLGTALVELGRGRLAAATGDLDEAVAIYAGVVGLLDRDALNEPFEFGVAYEALGDVRVLQGNAEGALAAFRLALDVLRKCEVKSRIDRIVDKVAKVAVP